MHKSSILGLFIRSILIEGSYIVFVWNFDFLIFDLIFLVAVNNFIYLYFLIVHHLLIFSFLAKMKYYQNYFQYFSKNP